MHVNLNLINSKLLIVLIFIVIFINEMLIEMAYLELLEPFEVEFTIISLKK